MIFRQETTAMAFDIEEIYKGVNLFPIITETQTVPTTTPKVANKITTSIKDFAQSVELSKDLFDDNRFGVWSKTVRDLALKARVSQDANAFKIFRGAFTTTLTADGVALCGNHALLNGAFYSNNLYDITAASTVLSSTSLNAAIVALAVQPDQTGVVLGQQPQLLLVPPALIKLALELSDSALAGDVSTNAINVFRSAYGYRVYSTPYIAAAAGGSDTAWFLMARNNGVKRIIRQGIETFLRPWGYSNNRTYLYQANFREEVVALDYSGVVGAKGFSGS
jgi:Mu-like prophage major head subunit gpT